ncbi:LysR family transcriptional regulator [Sporomusa malonica]|uniref:DNA-binding transcriptional regulator, LysR family n=1 Tax=Sporomusa malonica TaxID=112901 RepID=A0A1W1ZEM9_9FIRM|nr:LysR family transcriptional regulator [Sporomusa malonica]SMC46847.1 DNA-binding transcriptional regulator, LysR family [Sporomusa malonica]
MDIRSLRSFLMVAQCLSFTEAAKRIYIGQSALSKQIAELEEELGVELFFRHHRSLELTASGKTLLREGAILIDKVAEVVEKTKLAQRGIRGNLKIGCFGLEDAFLPHALRKFRSLYPQISLDIRLLTLKMIENGLESEDLDLGFTVLLGTESKTSRFMNLLIHRSPLCFLLPNDHKYAHETSIDISCLANDSFIMLYEAECQQGFDWIMDACKKRGFTPDIASKTTRMESVYWQVEAGIGVSFTVKDHSINHHIHSSISIVDMQGDDAVANVMAVWKKEHHNPAIPLFLKVLETIKA